MHMATAKTKQAQRKVTYAVRPKYALELTRQTLHLSENLGRSVYRQTVLEVLIGLLKDKDVHAKVTEKIATA